MGTSLTDSATGVVSSSMSPDDQGRAQIVTDTDNGKIASKVTTYTNQGQTQAEYFGSAGNANVGYVYYPTSGTPSNGSPGALQTLTVNLPGSQSAVPTSYAYDTNTKRLSTITVNGVTFTFGYVTNGDQVKTIAAGSVSTTLNPDSTDGARLGSISVTAAGHTVFSSGTYAYNQLDQRTADTVTRLNPDGTNDNYTAGYSYDPAHADALTGATTDDGHSYTFAYDGVGNRTTLGTVSNVNEYTAVDSYNQRGDETDDGTNSYAWDANDHLIGITPDHPSTGSLKESLGYDSQARLLWADFSVYTSGTWVYSYSRHYLWDGTDLVDVLDQNNTLLENFTWGPTGLIAVTDYPADPANPNPAGGPKTLAAIEDAQGSVIELVDPSNGAVDAAYHYGPYGENFSSSGSYAGVNPFGFQSALRDPSGKYYMLNRWYDPVQGRFLSRDPSGELNGGLNLFSAFGNDPIQNSDSSGLYFTPESAKWDTGAELPGYRSYSQVFAEARAELALTYGNVPDSAIVARGTFSDTTIGDLVSSLESDKEDYYRSQHILLESDEEYAKDLAASRDPGSISADDRTPAQRALDEQINEAMSHPEAPPEGLIAAQLLRNNDGSLLGALFDAAVMRAPDIAAAIAGLNSPTESGAMMEGLLPAEQPVVRGQGTIPASLAPSGGQSLTSGQLEAVGPSAAWINDPAFSAAGEGIGIGVNNAGFPNPMVEVTRTTPPQLIADARAQFESLRTDATSRPNFLRQYAATPAARAFFSDAELRDMEGGLVPEGWVVHHMQPLFRGGDNSYDNLILVPRQWHTDNFFDLHFYPPGKNPFGRN